MLHQLRKFAITGAIAALMLASVAVPTASAAVNYSPVYWELLDRYASVELPVEYTGAPFRGVYYGNPAAPPEECEEACGDIDRGRPHSEARRQPPTERLARGPRRPGRPAGSEPE